MSHSEEYYHSVNHQDQFNDSVIIQPISLKPNIIPSFLNKNHHQNTILSTYDHIKLTQFIESTENGKIIQLVHLQENSFMTTLTQEGIEFFQKFSGNQISFVTVIGEKSAGKSFLIDKILNLSNIQGNKFCTSNQRPGLYMWSIPFIKQDLRIFIVQLANCSMQSKQFSYLFPYSMLLSSAIINLQSSKDKNGYSSKSTLLQKLLSFSKRFDNNENNKQGFQRHLINNILPQKIINLKRKVQEVSTNIQVLKQLQIYSQIFYLPTAKNPQYRGIDEDLKVHSFLNKKCINQEYIHKVSQLFKKVYSFVLQKKQGELIFNGSITLKYLQRLETFFNKKKQINLQQIYCDIVKELYVSAYNYCVITYHQLLEQALSDEQPRSIDQLLEIFETASDQIFQRYHEFTLEKSLHEDYEKKLVNHIESKEKLIMEINQKKANLQLMKIYDNQINFNDMNRLWLQISQISKKNKRYSHGEYEVLGKKLVEYLPKILQGDNEEKKIKKRVEQLKLQIESKRNTLNQILLVNKQKRQKNTKINQEMSIKKVQIEKKIQQYDDKITYLNKEIKIYSKSQDLNAPELKEQQKKLTEMSEKNQKTIQKLRKQQNQPIENHSSVVEAKKSIQNVKKKQQHLILTLSQLSQQKNNNIDREQPTGLKQNNKPMKKSTQSNNIKQSNKKSTK